MSPQKTHKFEPETKHKQKRKTIECAAVIKLHMYIYKYIYNYIYTNAWQVGSTMPYIICGRWV